MSRLAVITALLAAFLAGPAVAADGKDVYESACRKCHRTGIDDAPKAGDKAAWAARIATGTPSLVKSVIEGKGAMDPRGGKAELTDDEIRAAVDYLVGLAK
jgi:cytochrome c5